LALDAFILFKGPHGRLRKQEEISGIITGRGKAPGTEQARAFRNKREAPWEAESAYKILDFWANVPISRQTKGRSELGSRC